jgi:hypothetical protein
VLFNVESVVLVQMGNCCYNMKVIPTAWLFIIYQLLILYVYFTLGFMVQISSVSLNQRSTEDSQSKKFSHHYFIL